MAILRDSGKESGQLEEFQAEPESPFQGDEETAWEPFDENVWIPYRIRGSWRGGVLG